MATRWTIALVDPPIAISVVIALSKEPRDRKSRGLRSSQTISTIRLPVSVAMRAWLESTAGIERNNFV